MAKTRRKRRSRGLGDQAIGPATRKVEEIRSGVRGVRQAIDHHDCTSAFALITATERAVGRVSGIAGLDNERAYFSVEKDRFKKVCMRKP